MDNEQNRTPFITLLFRYFRINFSVTIITITIAGMLLSYCGITVENTGTLFPFSGSGLAYETILQLAAFSMIIAFFSLLLFEERFFPHLRFWGRIFFFMLTTLITASFFVMLFKWFPLDEIGTWVIFAVLTIAGFAVSYGLTMLRIKRERKEYEKLLAKYKAQHNKNEEIVKLG